jgi:hypothetical protein
MHLEHGRLLEFATDPEIGDGRFIERGEIARAFEDDVAVVRPRLAGMTSIIVVLPAPFGPMMARISPGSTVRARLLSALKPSNETLTPLR